MITPPKNGGRSNGGKRNMVMPILILGTLGVVFAAFLTYFNIKFRVEENPLTGRIYELMPKANCGACGLAGCAVFAELLSEKKAEPEKCVMLSEDDLAEICKIMGIESKGRAKDIAKLKCFGGDNSKKKFAYNSVLSCNALNSLFGTNLECAYGCLGYGDCVRVCPADAMTMRENGLPLIDEKKCTGCGKCVFECPKNIIELVPEANTVHVACSSCDRGPAVVKACKTGCIGCGKCVKVCPREAIRMENNIAIIDYSKCDNCGTCVDNCPRKIIFKTGIESEQLA